MSSNGTGAIAVAQPGSTVLRADDWNHERVEFIRRAFCGGAPDGIASTFIEISKRRGLAPEERHIYLVERGKGNWVIQTGIDGYRSLAERSGEYAGNDDPVYDTETAKNPNRATVTVWRMKDGQRCPFTATARWSEYQAGSPIWNRMPYLMLGKCAEALALRKAFPAQLAGIYTDAEMDQAENATPPPQRAPERPQAPPRPTPPQQPTHPPQTPPAPQDAIQDAEVRDVPADRATPDQLRALWTAADRVLGAANKEPAVRGLLALRDMESTKQLSRQQTSNLIDYLSTTPPAEILATAGVASADDAGQAAMPMDGSNEPSPDEAALINFRERAESGENWLALLDEAGASEEHLCVMAETATTIGQSNTVRQRAKERGRYTTRFIAAEGTVRPGLEARAEALTR